jgi:hypothetical protein
VTITAETFLLFMRSSNALARLARPYRGRTWFHDLLDRCLRRSAHVLLSYPAEDDVLVVQHDAVVVEHPTEFAGAVADMIPHATPQHRISIRHLTATA